VIRTGGRFPESSASTTDDGTSIPVAVLPFVSRVARNCTSGRYTGASRLIRRREREG
jgi:hypothetical protein